MGGAQLLCAELLKEGFECFPVVAGKMHGARSVFVFDGDQIGGWEPGKVVHN